MQPPETLSRSSQLLSCEIRERMAHHLDIFFEAGKRQLVPAMAAERAPACRHALIRMRHISLHRKRQRRLGIRHMEIKFLACAQESPEDIFKRQERPR